MRTIGHIKPDMTLSRAEIDADKAAWKALEDEIKKLRHPYRNADALDWDHLFRMLPDSGHGQFWKAVMTEVREALATSK